MKPAQLSSFVLFCQWLLISVHSVNASAMPLGASLTPKAEVSSSKRLMKSVESPLSTSVITSRQIVNAGATNIPEALRMIPGVIVRELTNGQYEVHIRGLDNAPISASLTELSNQNTLIMIDGRVVFEYFFGVTFWDTLPVNINDVDRIEVVRGASSSLYGPNAGTGVIHILTKRGVSSEDAHIELNSLNGSHATKQLHASINGSLGEHNWRLSGSDTSRDRYTENYYSYPDQEYVPVQTLNPARGLGTFPHPKQAQHLKNVNLAVNNDPASYFAYDLTLSHHEANAHKSYVSGETSFSFNESKSDAINLKLNYENWYVQASLHDGEHFTASYPEFDYTYRISQSSLEYQYRIPKLIVRPGIRYDEIEYDGVFIKGKHTLRNQSYMLRSEYDPIRDVKLIGSLSIDEYYPTSDSYLAYQFSISKKLDSASLVRAGIQRANRSSFMINSFLDLDFTLALDPSQRLTFVGDPNAKLLTFETLELGYRHAFSFYESIDVELFLTQSDDHSAFIKGLPYVDGTQTVTPSTLQALPIKVEQVGLTIDWEYLTALWSLNSFITFQQTKIKDQILELFTPLETDDLTDKGTPSVYGGVVFNWTPSDKWNLNTSIYFMDDYVLELLNNPLESEHAFQTILNTTIRYSFSEAIQGSLGVKNLTNHQSSQYFFTDEIKPTIQLGLNITL